MRSVRAAIAPSTTSAADSGKSSVWCSPMPKKSTPTWSARTPCSTTSRIVWAWDSGRSSRVVGDVAEGVEAEDERELRGLGCGGGHGVRRCCRHGGSSLWCEFVLGRRLRYAACGAYGLLELGPAQRHAEDRAAGFEEADRRSGCRAGRRRSRCVDELRPRPFTALGIVAGDAERPALRRAGGTAFFFEFVVADVVERLDDRRPGQPVRDDLAAAVAAGPRTSPGRRRSAASSSWCRRRACRRPGRGRASANLCSGIASTTMSASSTASAAHRGSAPGTSTCVISAISAGSPDAAMDTW